MRYLKKDSRIPFEIGHLICTCEKPKWDNVANRSTKCLECGRFMFVFARKCQDCEKWYITDFRHPNTCNIYPLCWDCISKTTRSICDTISSAIAHYYCRDRYFDERPPEPYLLEERSRELDLTIPDIPDFDLTF